jgi:putative addiction module component (TIGR02574 family)
MSNLMQSLGIDQLPVDQRLALLEQIWDSISQDRTGNELTEAQRTELLKRLQDDDENPDDVVPWEDIKAESLRRLS